MTNVKEITPINPRSLLPGSYQLHVFIEETRGLIMKSESPIDPVIKLSAFGITRYSSQKAHRGVGMIYWSEHFFFDKKLSEYNELELEKLYIQVFDHNLLKTNSLIGELEIDLVSIYFANKHALMHQWAGLTNIKQNREEIKGYLKFSCSCIGPQDEPIAMADSKTKASQLLLEGNISELEQPGMMFPPFIKIQGWQIVIRLVKGENLVKMDRIGSIDTFLVFQFGTAKYRTKTIKNNPKPEWNMMVYLPFSEPTINEVLSLSIWDQDIGKSDEIVGNITFQLKDIKENKYSKFLWLNLYGAHPDKSKSLYGQLMDSSPQMGSFWKGRLLLSLECNPHNSPIFSDPNQPEPIPKEILKKASTANTSWQLITSVFYGFSFPQKDKKYSIKVRWADRELLFDDPKPELGILKWFQSKSIHCDFPYREEELPDLLIYLCQGQELICFIRKKIETLEADPKLYFFLPDPSISLKKPIRKHNAGIVKLGFQITASQLSGEKELKPVNRSLEESKLVPGLLIAHIFLAQDLIPADANGSSDPYYKISFYGQEARGETVMKSLNPVWYKTHYMEVMVFPKEESPPILLAMYDKDPIGKEFIGSCLLNVQKGIQEDWIAWKEDRIPKPVWHELEYENQTNCGQILASFQFLEGPPKANLLKTVDIRPKTEKYQVVIKILGLRGLKSLGLFPVSRPFIKFDINGMKTNERKESLYEKKSLKTQPSEVGSNPNICTILTFEVELPIDTTYCPSLNCMVFDWLLKGLSEPTLGTFTINFPQYIHKTNERVKRKLSKPNFPQIPSVFNLESNISPPSSFLELTSFNLNKPLLHNPLSDITKKIAKPLIYSDIYKENDGILSENLVRRADYGVDKSKKLMCEIDIQDEALFRGLGYDTQLRRCIKKEIKRHYRHYIDCELEKSPFMDKETFDEFIIRRGKRFSDENNDFYKVPLLVTNQKEVGKFKGWISIMSETNRSLLETKKLKSRTSNTLIEKIERNILEKTPCLIRIYVLRAENLPRMDLFSDSDPYLKLILGNEEQNNRKEHQTDKVNCDFYKLFVFKATLPGASQLKIQVWDYDFLLPDDLIGETTIDLENRFFSKKWRKLKHIPIETRDLIHPLHCYEKNGRLSLWLEILPLPLPREDILWDITPKPPMEFEIRLVVWEVDDVPSMDLEDCSDIYIEGSFRGRIQRTDTHFRAQNGFGSFNWRMVWPVVLSDEDMDLTVSFQVWDKDFFSPNDYIAEGTLDFEVEAREAYKNDGSMKKTGKKEVKLSKKFEKLRNEFVGGKETGSIIKEEEKFVLELKNFEKNDMKLKTKGKLTLSFEIVPKSFSKENPVGLGRSEPNHSPWLPPPVGRFEWSANPFKLFTRCVGPKARAKACTCICLTLCIIICISIAPIVIGNLVSRSFLFLE